MKRPAILIALGFLSSLGQAAPFDATLRQMQGRIDYASERGRIEEARVLRRDLAQQAIRAGYFLEASRQYELLLASRPAKKERVRLFTELGRLREAISDWSGAIHAYADARHDDPQAWDATLAQARVFVRLDMYRQAEENYEVCLKLRPDSVEAMDELGGVYRERGFLPKAIAMYEKAIALKPGPNSYVGLAECYRRRHDWGRALEIIQQGEQKAPSSIYDVARGGIYRRMGQPVKAIASWETALEADPTRDDLRLSLIFLKEQTGQRAAADALLASMVKTYPRSPLVQWTRAWVMKRRGDRTNMLKATSVVDELSPTDLVKHYNERLRQEMKP